MKRLLLLSAIAAPMFLIGCGGGSTTFVRAETTTLGRVVVYRNGVAYFERYARINDGTLRLAVPGDKVDDFLKSLTVVDAKTGEPAPISYPTASGTGPSGTIDMKVNFKGNAPHDLKLSYVTDAPSWKPSYRVVVGKGKSIDLQAWAVVDNTSGEDWNAVKLGVGSSSAMSFRFDLRSVRVVARETLQPESLFAFAPPTGGTSYGGAVAPATPAMAPAPEPVAEELAMNDAPKDDRAGSRKSGRDRASMPKAAPQAMREAGMGAAGPGRGAPPPPPRVVHGNASGAVDAKKELGANAQGLASAAPPNESTEPIGTSHFESGATMNVARGTSAMISILHSDTEGEVVYLYDPESARGNAMFPFKAVRVRNPTDSMLESGPVTVFGEGRFIGEGLADAIPARSVAFVPFALDRQIVVEQKDNEKDTIARIVTVQRGIFSTEVQHTKRSTFTLFNRLPERATVYVRHTVAKGYALTKGPENPERIGGAHLFRIELAPNAKTDVEIEETTPRTTTTDIRTAAGAASIAAYLSSSTESGALNAQVASLVKLQKEIGTIDEQVATVREQMVEYRSRMDELHAQLVTLKAVRTAGPLMAHLEKKLQEVSEKLSRATLEIVSLEEKRMVARVHFQDGVADLSLAAPAPPATPPSATAVGAPETSKPAKTVEKAKVAQGG